jgi:bifunctional pyridoxal-dependent enzyme with beta-cystathionase and maltose regulon repressor activities
MRKNSKRENERVREKIMMVINLLKKHTRDTQLLVPTYHSFYYEKDQYTVKRFEMTLKEKRDQLFLSTIFKIFFSF